MKSRGLGDVYKRQLLILLKKISHRLCNPGEVLDESMVITSHPEKTSDILDGFRGLPVEDSLNLIGDNSNPFGGNMTKEYELL